MKPQEETIFLLLRGVIDPELMLNIIDLGLVYKVEYNETDKKILIEMTLTSPGCPMGDTITNSAKNILKNDYPDFTVEINLVWEPAWGTDKLTPLGKLALGAD